MNWVAIILSGVAGGVAVLVSRTIMRKLGRGIAIVHYIVFGVAFALALFFAQYYALPQVAAMKTESELLAHPVYQALSEYEPAVYAQVVKINQDSVANKTSSEMLRAQTLPILSAVIARRTKSASDEALQQLSRVLIDIVTKLHARGDESCFQVLYPQSGPPIDYTHFVGKGLGRRELEAQAAIIRSSATTPQPAPNEAEVARSFQVVGAVLKTKYTNAEIAMLDNPGIAGVDKRKICEMTADLFSEALKLPKQDSGKLLRFMMSGQ